MAGNVNLVATAGLEPATPALWMLCSNQLSYVATYLDTHHTTGRDSRYMGPICQESIKSSCFFCCYSFVTLNVCFCLCKQVANLTNIFISRHTLSLLRRGIYFFTLSNSWKEPCRSPTICFGGQTSADRSWLLERHTLILNIEAKMDNVTVFDNVISSF